MSQQLSKTIQPSGSFHNNLRYSPLSKLSLKMMLVTLCVLVATTAASLPSEEPTGDPLKHVSPNSAGFSTAGRDRGSVVKITLDGKFVCYGTIISSYVVITSGACFPEVYNRKMNYKVVVGVFTDTKPQLIHVKEIDNYKTGAPWDLAKVYLSKPVEFLKGVSMADSPRSTDFYNKECRVPYENGYSMIQIGVCQGQDGDKLLCSNVDQQHLINYPGDGIFYDNAIVGVVNPNSSSIFTNAFPFKEWLLG